MKLVNSGVYISLLIMNIHKNSMIEKGNEEYSKVQYLNFCSKYEHSQEFYDREERGKM